MTIRKQIDTTSPVFLGKVLSGTQMTGKAAQTLMS
jgi:hypothetical protein